MFVQQLEFGELILNAPYGNVWSSLILWHVACEVPLSHCCKSGSRYVRILLNLTRAMFLEKRARNFQAILAAIQFRISHELVHKLVLFLSFCLGF